MSVPKSVAQAIDGRDFLAMTLYSRLVSWVVCRINQMVVLPEATKRWETFSFIYPSIHSIITHSFIHTPTHPSTHLITNLTHPCIRSYIDYCIGTSIRPLFPTFNFHSLDYFLSLFFLPPLLFFVTFFRFSFLPFSIACLFSFTSGRRGIQKSPSWTRSASNHLS